MNSSANMSLLRVPLTSRIRLAGAMAILVAAGSAFPPALAGADETMEDLPTLSDQGAGGTFLCPDGSTRTYQGDPPNDLFKSMKCSGPPEGAGGAEAAVQAKDAAAEQQAALQGQSGVKAGLEATSKTGRPDYLLRFPWVWAAGLVAAFAVAGAVLSRLLGAKK